MEYLNDFSSDLLNDPDIMALSTELVGIQSAYSLTLEKTEDLTAQIRDCEFRLNYFDASMAEGQRIASEVLSGAELRVENITAGSNRLIIPQRKLIARIENEISELSQLLASLTTAAENPVPEKSQPATDNIEIMSGFPHKKMTTETSVYSTTDIIPSDQPLQSDHDTDTFVGADSIRPDQSMQSDLSTTEMSLDADQPLPSDHYTDTLVGADIIRPEQSIQSDLCTTEMSLDADQPLSSDHYTDTLVGADIIRPEQSIQSDLCTTEMSLDAYQPLSSDHYTDTLVGADSIRPDQSMQSDLSTADTFAGTKSIPEIAEEAPAAKSALPLKVSLQQPTDNKNTETDPEGSIEPAFKIKLPQHSAEDMKVEAVPPVEPPVVQEYRPEKLEAKPEVLPEETDKTLLNLEVPLRFSFYDGEVQKPEALRSHEWLVKMLIKIPEDNYEFVRYGKGPQDIKSTLLRYDNAVLNDMYPFDIITPSRPNIAMYFFNCLEDNVSFMKLRLREISIWENQTLLMRINHRNKVLDELLQSGDDMLENLRGKFISQ